MKDGRYSCVVFPDKPDKNIHLESKFGGPLVCLNENESFELQGIAATESLSINDGNAALFTNIYNNLGWLEEKMSAWTEWTPCSTECSRQRNRVCTKAGYKIDVSSFKIRIPDWWSESLSSFCNRCRLKLETMRMIAKRPDRRLR